MSRAGIGDLRWGIEQRLTFIEERLYWLGTINRQDLIDRFGVSMSQASTDINKYLALSPRGVAYDKSAKCYVADDDFSPVMEEASASRLLAELRLVDIGVLTPEATTLGVVPPFDATPVPERAVAPDALRAVWRAIGGSKALEIMYQSMSRPEPVHRIIEPHALAHDGFRWHVRAFDRESDQFRDFVLGRISNPKQAGPRERDPAADAAWNSRVELHIAPHPDLTPEQQAATRLDYGITGDYLVLEVRQALLFYALKRLGLDTPPGARPPQEQHIVLLNRDAVLEALPASGND